jgi:DNA-binding transcriptional MerR regulator
MSESSDILSPVQGPKPITIKQSFVSSVAIPNRPVFRAHEVCEIAEVQPYVLRSWEAEFPDLGVTKSASSPRVYRRADVERVLRLKHLLFVDGLTLAGARKQLNSESPAPIDATVSDADVAALVNEETRRGLADVRRGLQWILSVLSGDGLKPEDFVLQAEPAVVRVQARKAAPHAPARKKVAKTRRRGH